ncbi:MAG TPA: group 1 glycosyl transferase, partial [Desulfovibrio sp.]|nr:group 1 glycosyl transferase [Desulfovibrio sp.]
DGDVLDAALCLEQAVGLIERGGPDLDGLLAAGQATAQAYGLEAFETAVLDVWAELER